MTQERQQSKNVFQQFYADTVIAIVSLVTNHRCPSAVDTVNGYLILLSNRHTASMFQFVLRSNDEF